MKSKIEKSDKKSFSQRIAESVGKGQLAAAISQLIVNNDASYLAFLSSFENSGIDFSLIEKHIKYIKKI